MLVCDERFYTAAGIEAPLHLALALVEEDYGYDFARQVARGLQIHLRPSTIQSAFRAAPQRVARSDAMRELQTWIASHLDEPLSVRRLSALAHMSPRTFAREFVHDLGITPAKYVEETRVEGARHLLERTSIRLEQIARQCGFSSTDSMRRTLLRALHITPAEYRRNFQKVER